MLNVLPKGTPYYTIDYREKHCFYLDSSGLRYTEKDYYLFFTNHSLSNITYKTLSKNDKVLFSKNVNFPVSSINRLNDLGLKKVNSKYDKVIIDPVNHDINRFYYMIKYNDIYYKLDYGYIRNQDIHKYSEERYPGIEIYKVYLLTEKDANLLYYLETESDKLVHIKDFFEFYIQSRPMLDKESFNSLVSMLNSDEINRKLATDLLVQYNFLKYLPELYYICSKEATLRTLKKTKSGQAILYICGIWDTFPGDFEYRSKSPFQNAYHIFKNLIIRINNSVSRISQEYVIKT